MPAIAS